MREPGSIVSVESFSLGPGGFMWGAHKSVLGSAGSTGNQKILPA